MELEDIEIRIDLESLPDDLTQEELDHIIDAVKQHIKDGTLEENSVPLSDQEIEYLEEYLNDDYIRKLN